MSPLNGQLTHLSVDVLELSTTTGLRPSHYRLPDSMTVTITVAAGLFVSSTTLGVIVWLGALLRQGEWLPATFCFIFAGFLCWLIYLLMLGVFSSGVWFQFDRKSGSVIRLQRPFGFWRLPRVVSTWPLRNVESVHVVYVGEQTVRHTQHIQSGLFDTISRTTQHHVYRFQLLMKPECDSAQIVILETADLSWLLAAAQQVSEFCQLPLVDELSHEAPATEDRNSV